jgi:hypothetical protein
MRILKFLEPGARRQITPGFCEGAAEPDVAAYVAPFPRELDIEPLINIVRRGMAKFIDPEESDGWLAPRVHASLRLYRNEAADPRLWSYLGVVELPGYVRWRWKGKEGKPAMADRFIGAQFKQALSRLWWSAEMTRNGPDYNPTVTFFNRQDFPNTWLRFNAFHHRPAALAAIKFLSALHNGDFATGREINRVGRAFNMALTTSVLDAVAENPPPDMPALEDWVNSTVDETLMYESLPRGPEEPSVPDDAVKTTEALIKRIADSVLERLVRAAPTVQMPEPQGHPGAMKEEGASLRG